MGLVTERRPADYTKASDERARAGRREVRLQLAPETARVIEALAQRPGRQGFSDALNQILERYEQKER